MKNVKINFLTDDKSIKIVQCDDYFKFSTDSIFLSNFISLKYTCKKILDIGTGNAPIPLILSTKTKAKIIGVEIQKEICDLAVKSVKLNNLENQIAIINDDINNFYINEAPNQFDIITCNPPYFKNSIVNKNKIKTIARHETTLNLELLCKVAKKLLKNNGIFALIHRTERIIEIIEILRKNNLEPKKIQLIYSSNKKESNLVLIDAVKNGKVGLKFLYPIIIKNKR